jgi:polyisoprenoid-binding protein YceI
MNIKPIAPFLLLALTLQAAFAQTRWNLASSTVSFSIKNAGINVNGSFGTMRADLNFYPEHLAASTISARLDVNTLNTGIDLRDKHLKKEEYFDAAKYPNIQIKSVSFAKNKDGNFVGTFQLGIKKTTKQITVPFSYSESGTNAKFSAQFILNRRDFGVGESSWTMSDEVTVSVQCIASR